MKLCKDIIVRSEQIKEKFKDDPVRTRKTRERREKKMNNSGDAAEQIVRFGFEGAEVALKITGAAAKKYCGYALCSIKGSETDTRKSAAGQYD